MSWFVFAFLSGASDILYNFATRNSLKNSSKSLEFSWAMTTLRSAIFLPAIFELTNSSLSFRHFVLLFGLGAITVINILIFMKMHSLNELSISAIIVRLRTVWVPLVALVLIGERLVFTEYLGIFITFLAVAVISSPRRIVKDKAMSVALLFSITGSILGVAMKAASEIFSPNLIVLAMSLPSAVVLPLFAKDKVGLLLKSWSSDLKGKIVITFFAILTPFFFATALAQGGTASATTAIYQGVSVLSVAAGIVFLRERSQVVKKLVAGALAVLGVYLLV